MISLRTLMSYAGGFLIIIAMIAACLMLALGPNFDRSIGIGWTVVSASVVVFVVSVVCAVKVEN